MSSIAAICDDPAKISGDVDQPATTGMPRSAIVAPIANPSGATPASNGSIPRAPAVRGD
jgi:hypothetical protein